MEGPVVKYPKSIKLMIITYTEAAPVAASIFGGVDDRLTTASAMGKTRALNCSHKLRYVIIKNTKNWSSVSS